MTGSNAGMGTEERTQTKRWEEATHENLLRNDPTLLRDPSSLLSSAAFLL